MELFLEEEIFEVFGFIFINGDFFRFFFLEYIFGKGKEYILRLCLYINIML